VLGPSASGKSQLALDLARELNGSILCIDSTTVYRHLNVGTAKPGPAERQQVPHYLLDLLELDQSASVAWFKRQAQAALGDVQAQGRCPILVGGSHLYFKALLEGYDIPEVSADWNFRGWADQQPLSTLWDELIARDPACAGLVDRQNPRRVIRALEVVRSGLSFSSHYSKSPPELRVLKIGLEVDPDWLRERIRRRIEQMLASGWVEEVRAILKNGHRQDLERLRVIGYCEILELLDEKLSQSAAVEQIFLATWRLVKKQRTWYRREQREVPENDNLNAWLPAEAPDLLARALELVEQFRCNPRRTPWH
jgi:tRNA dimethylallyltransferase